MAERPRLTMETRSSFVDFEKQKPVSDEYKRNWERIFGCASDSSEAIEKRESFWDSQSIQVWPEGERVAAFVCDGRTVLLLDWRMQDSTRRLLEGFAKSMYSNGCPILNEGSKQ